jgi:hypothetical protein
MSGIDQYLSGVSGDVIGWTVGLAILAGLSLLIMRIELPKRTARVPRAAYAPRAVEFVQSAAPAVADPAWRRLMRKADETADPAARAVETQRGAGQHIDAAEHAFNRLLADCEGVMTVPVKPTLRPARELSSTPPVEQPPVKQPIAA